ncbi:hypothetical protein LIER_10769 [Lithospermum erythrorhizon]|uniref:Uncharacterized protein n=1 Tax=Lithospermum erythrorhizon TaxID=34254 RepID=A0AAV3PND1_LITER
MDTVDGWKDSTFLEEDLLEPSLVDTIAKGMDTDIPSVDDIELVTVAATEKVTPSVIDTAIETVGQEEIDTMDDDVEDMTPEKARQQKKKSKKRRLRKLADTAENSEPKKKLSKEDRAAKRARKVERRARKAAEAKTGQDNNVEEVMPEETEEVIPPVVQPSIDDEWLPEHEQQGDNEDDQSEESDKDDVDAVMDKRRKTKGKLRMKENRTRIGNRRIPRNVAAVPTTNVSLNSKEEQAKWKFVVNRCIVAEKLLTKVTQKNPNIMSILEKVGVMPTVEAAGPYYPKLVREFICNMTEDIDDIVSPNHHKVLYMIGIGASFDLGRVIFDQTVQYAHVVLKPIAYPSILYSILLAQNEDILTKDDTEGLALGVITISPKLMEGIHVVDVPLAPLAEEGASGSHTNGTVQLLRDEIKYLNGVIQSSLARKSVFEARVRSLTGDDDPDDGAEDA